MNKILTRYFVLLIVAASIIIPVSSSAVSLPVASSSATEPDPATVRAAIKEFKSLPRSERKHRIKEVKKELKKFKADKRAGKEQSDNTVLLVILAILLPPLAVYLHQGEINNKFWISLILTILFWLPGVIYALVVVLGGA